MNCIIDRSLLLLKLLYFFELSVISCLFIYLTPFMYEWGVTATEMAVISFIANIFAFISRPFFGYIADKYQKYKELIIILAVSCAISFSLFLASPKYSKKVFHSPKSQYNLNISVDENVLTVYTSYNFSNVCWSSNLSQCHLNGCNISNFNLSLYETGMSYANYMSSIFINSCKSSPQSMFCENMSTNCNNSQQSAFESSSKSVGLTWSAAFWIILLTKTSGFIFFSPMVSLTDAVTFVILGSKNANKFGFTRMFGTIGVLVFSLIIAGILEGLHILKSHWILVHQMQIFSQFSICFVAAAILFMVVAIIAFRLRIDKPVKKKGNLRNQSKCSQFLEVTSLDILFRDLEMRFFFLFAILGGFVYQVFGEYFFLMVLIRFPDSPKYVPGLITVVMTVSESVVFGFSSHLLNLRNYEFWVSVSFIAWGLRWISYVFINNFWLLLLTELLNGPSFGLMLACMMAHVGKLGSERTQGRLQGMFSSIYFHIGGALGGVVGGLILDNFGMFGLFKFMSVLSFLCGCYHPLQIYMIGRLCKSSKSPPTTIEVFDIGDHNTQLLFDEKI